MEQTIAPDNVPWPTVRETCEFPSCKVQRAQSLSFFVADQSQDLICAMAAINEILVSSKWFSECQVLFWHRCTTDWAPCSWIVGGWDTQRWRQAIFSATLPSFGPGSSSSFQRSKGSWNRGWHVRSTWMSLLCWDRRGPLIYKWLSMPTLFPAKAQKMEPRVAWSPSSIHNVWYGKGDSHTQTTLGASGKRSGFSVWIKDWLIDIFCCLFVFLYCTSHQSPVLSWIVKSANRKATDKSAEIQSQTARLQTTLPSTHPLKNIEHFC